jgi:hypothetical protein
LSSENRAALAAWADDGDGPDGFADRVVVAFLAQREADVDDALDEADEADDEVIAAEPRAAVGDGRVLRMVGLVAAVAAAAAVMLMVRVLPGAPEGVEVADAGRFQHAGVGDEPPDRRDCEHAEAGAGPSLAELPAQGQPSPPQPDLAILGAQAATVLAQHCSPCHDSTDPEANPNALQIFDLEQPQWWLTMSDAQLEDARTRVQELEAATDDERGRVKAFVEVQLRQRAHAG